MDDVRDKIERPKQVSEPVLERLRNDIIENRFALGEKIPEAQLSELYGVTKVTCTPSIRAAVSLAMNHSNARQALKGTRHSRGGRISIKAFAPMMYGADDGARTRTLYEKQIFLPLRLSPPPSGVRGLDCPFTVAERL